MDLKTFLEILAPEVELWPRKAMTAKTKGQIQVKNLPELEALIEEADRMDCYIQTHNDSMKNRNILSVVFIDLDFKGDLKRAWKVYLKVARHLQEKYYVEDYYAQFSAFKGYHVLIPIKPVITPDPHAFLRFMQIRFSKGYCDPQLLGDVVRLVRLPGTFNTKVAGVRNEKGKVIPLCEWGREPTAGELMKIRRDGLVKPIREWNGERYDPGLLWEEFKISKLSEKLRSKPRIKRIEATGEVNSKVRPCILEALKHSLEGEDGHLMRLAIAVEHLNKGYSVDQVVDLFRFQGDFDEEKTRYYVEDAARRGYKPFKCETIRDLGYCLGPLCKITTRERDKCG